MINQRAHEAKTPTGIDISHNVWDAPPAVIVLVLPLDRKILFTQLYKYKKQNRYGIIVHYISKTILQHNMTKMSLMAPAESMETTKNVISTGADEIYIGLETPGFANLNLSGRGRSCNVTTQDQCSLIPQCIQRPHLRAKT